MVTNLALSGIGCIGTIPPAIGNLTALRQLWIDSNSISGAIPHTLGNLESLEQLALLNNQLTSTIPPRLVSRGPSNTCTSRETA